MAWRIAFLLVVSACSSKASEGGAEQAPPPPVVAVTPPSASPAPVVASPAAGVIDASVEKPSAADEKPSARPTDAKPSKKGMDTVYLEEEATATIGLLFADEEGSAGTGARLDDVINELRKADEEPGTSGARRPDLPAPAAGSSRGLSSSPTDSSRVRARLVFGTATLGAGSSLTEQELMRKLRSMYTAGLKRCVEQRLKIDPTAVGSVQLHFTVSESGRTADARVTGDADEQLTGCLRGRLVSWRFSPPKDADGEPTTVDVAVPLQFKPS